MSPDSQHRRLRVNIGCGATPTPGWLNFDNSLTVRLAEIPGLPQTLRKFGVLTANQLEFASVARRHGIRWANAARRIPLQAGSVGVVYNSHMLEHLDPNHEAPRFLEEARRVLVPGGIIRIAVPDLLRMARSYVQSVCDADGFVSSLYMADGTTRGGLALIRFLVGGGRHHRWMYDAASLICLVERHGFCSARELPPGETMIPDSGSLNLREREEETIYVEGFRVQ